MMNPFLLAMVLFVLFMPPLQSDVKLEIGFVLPRKYIEEWEARTGEKEIKWIATHPSQLRPFFVKKIEGIIYLIAFQQDNREIRYIQTFDKNFRTEDGLKVGGCIHYSDAQIQRIISWEIRAPQTKDGWYPVLGNYFSPSHRNSAAENCWVITGFSKGGN